MNTMRSCTKISGTCPTRGLLPSSQLYTDQGQGYSFVGLPFSRGSGIETGRNGAIFGSHSNSLPTFSTAQSMRGSLTNLSLPRRYKALSVPADGTGLSGKLAQCGNCFEIS